MLWGIGWGGKVRGLQRGSVVARQRPSPRCCTWAACWAVGWPGRRTGRGGRTLLVNCAVGVLGWVGSMACGFAGRRAEISYQVRKEFSATTSTLCLIQCEISLSFSFSCSVYEEY